jgi:aminopeptidase-like protein
MSVKKYYQLAKHSLFLICRSLTGAGVRKTLKIVKKEFPSLKICKIPSGAKAFDWKVPPEWNVKDAYILDKNNKKIIDFKKNNLHLVGYSIPVDKFFFKKKLFNHIYSLPKQPKAIPYITSYYKKYWGFCVTHNEKLKFNKNYKNSDRFKVIIKSNLNSQGYLNYGELILNGKSKQEILISTYLCHPSMANDDLSGPIVSMCLINHFSKIKNLEKTIRFIFIPETIGSITYLSRNLPYLKANVVGGFNLTCIGDERQHSCMFSKYGNTPSDRAIVEAYNKLKIKFKKYSFLERGSDERQYNSPGVDLPIASIFRTKYGKFSEYHTSLDNFNLVTEKGVRGGFNVAKEAIKILNKKKLPKNKILCEPQMGKRSLYPTLSRKSEKGNTRHYMNFLQYADGKNDLYDISNILKIKYNKTLKIYNILKKHQLIN